MSGLLNSQFQLRGAQELKRIHAQRVSYDTSRPRQTMFLRLLAVGLRKRMLAALYFRRRFYLPKVENGTCKATLVDSVTAQYRVADEYCGLDILLETFNDEHCEYAEGWLSTIRIFLQRGLKPIGEVKKVELEFLRPRCLPQKSRPQGGCDRSLCSSRHAFPTKDCAYFKRRGGLRLTNNG